MKNIFGRTAENWYLEELPQGTKVRFNDSVNHGTGTICGISGNGVPIAGKSYIIQLDNMIEGFAYSHISLPEIYLEVIDTIDIGKIAHLARLEFDEAKSEEMLKSINNILEWMKVLNNVDTENVKPLTHMSTEVNVLREDVIKDWLSHVDALLDSDYFRVPNVLEEINKIGNVQKTMEDFQKNYLAKILDTSKYWYEMNIINENILKHFGKNEITTSELISWLQNNKYRDFKLTITPDEKSIRIFDLTIRNKSFRIYGLYKEEVWINSFLVSLKKYLKL